MDFIERPWTFKPYAKPLHHQAELDPFARLRQGLVSAILFDVSGAVYDFVLTSRTFAKGYPFPTATPGVGSFTNGGFGTWTVSSGGVALLNGSSPAFSSGVVMLCYVNSTVYQINSAFQIYYWTGSTWLAWNAGDPRIGKGLVAFGDSVAGGTISSGGGGYLTMSSPAQTPGAWTVSSRMFFTGAVAQGSTIVATDGAGDVYFYIQAFDAGAGATPFSLSLNGDNLPVGSWLASAYTGFHRVTVTASAQTGTATFYFDGISQGTKTINVGTAQFACILADALAASTFSQRSLADVFVWNRALDALDVLNHAKNPYSGVLRPRFVRRDQSSGGAPVTKRRLGLTLQGVGP